MALAVEACRQTDFDKAGAREAQHLLGALEATLQDVAMGSYPNRLLEHARKVMQAQVSEPRQFA